MFRGGGAVRSWFRSGICRGLWMTLMLFLLLIRVVLWCDGYFLREIRRRISPFLWLLDLIEGEREKSFWREIGESSGPWAGKDMYSVLYRKI